MKCKICSNPVNIINDDKLKKRFYSCAVCEFISLKEEFMVSEAEEKERYLEHNNSIDDPKYLVYLKGFIHEAIEPFQKSIKNALDYGCGPAPVLAQILEEKGIKAEIYDKYFFPDQPYKENTYDLITLTEVIEHLADPVMIFKELTRLLNPGGYICAMTLFHPQNEESFLKWWYKYDITHISFFSLKTMKYIAELVNLEIVKRNDKNICVFRKIR
ncbi:MAG: class I SAM-dependent methyltransferase [Spirochaetes bacterium]|nr:class I SAM-dependent methyltransferase [Spirochaetota bacterium]